VLLRVAQLGAHRSEAVVGAEASVVQNLDLPALGVDRLDQLLVEYSRPANPRFEFVA
jgi:hypothetical protein